MARAAVATSPVVYFSDEGTHEEFPMSSIEFDDSGVLVTRPARDPSDRVLRWLRYQADRGRIVAGPTPPTPAALDVTAKQPGTTGNRIEVTTSTKLTTTAGAVDMQVSATDRYPNVKVAALAELLGTSGTPGTQPGLLQVETNPTNPVEPTIGVKAESTTTANTWLLTGTDLVNTTNVVVLEPRVGGADFDQGSVVLRIDEGTPNDTFTLTVVWTSPLLENVDPTVQNFDSTTFFSPEFDFLVEIDKPDGEYKLPRLGTVSLVGGKEPADAVEATATLLADD